MCCMLGLFFCLLFEFCPRLVEMVLFIQSTVPIFWVVKVRPTTNSWVMPLNSTHIQRIEFTKVNSHMHSILSLSSLWTQCEFSKLIVNSWVLPEFSHLSSFCAKKCHTKRENCLCKKRKLSACRWVYQGGTHTLWVYTQLSVDSVSAPGWVYTRGFTLFWVEFECCV